MGRTLIVRLLAVWAAFGVGTAVGWWIASRHASDCRTQIVDFDIDGLTNAAAAALPAATTGSGIVTFALDPSEIHIHADSALANRSYDGRVAAVVRGLPVTLEVRSDLLRRLLSR